MIMEFTGNGLNSSHLATAVLKVFWFSNMFNIQENWNIQ